MSTTNIPGVDRDGLAAAIHYNTRPITLLSANRAADVALAYIGDHHECVCDREHADDEWVKVDGWSDLPDGTRLRREWVRTSVPYFHYFAHRDDLPDPDKEKIERMAKALCKHDYPDDEWDDDLIKELHEDYRQAASVALAASREGE